MPINLDQSTQYPAQANHLSSPPSPVKWNWLVYQEWVDSRLEERELQPTKEKDAVGNSLWPGDSSLAEATSSAALSLPILFSAPFPPSLLSTPGVSAPSLSLGYWCLCLESFGWCPLSGSAL